MDPAATGRFAAIFRLGAGLTGVAGLVLILAAMLAGKDGPDIFREIVNFFSYFTVQSNIACAAAFLVPVLAPRSRAAGFLTRPAVRAGLATYIITTGLVYFLVLSAAWKPTGLMLAGNVLAHYAVPVLYVLDWLTLAPRGGLRPGLVPAMLAYPAAYAVTTLIHGALTGFYPYPFLNVDHLGLPRMLGNCLGLMAWLAFLGCLLTGADKLLGGGRRD